MNKHLAHWLAATVLAALATPAFAVYKCKDANGRTVFQERPCEATGSRGEQIEVKPATGQIVQAAPTAATTETATAPAEAPQTEADRIRNKADKLRKENRIHSLNNQEIPNAQMRIRGATNRCNERMRAVQNQKAYANNNLAGATWEQSLSTEMQAIATQCSAEQTRLNADLDRLLNEKRMLEQELQK